MLDRSDQFPPIRPEQLPIDIVLSRVPVDSYARGPTYSAQCPAHDDERPSLSITERDDGVVLIHCHAGCSVEEILTAIQLPFGLLYPSPYALKYGRRGDHTACTRSSVRGTAAKLTADELRQFVDRLRQSTATKQALRRLANMLHLPVKALRPFDLGHEIDEVRGERWLVPERDGQRRVVGISYRYPDGRKMCAPGGHRGLILPAEFMPRLGWPVYLTEGASDAFALTSVGEVAIGRPMAQLSKCCLEWLLELLVPYREAHIIVVGDRDGKGRRIGSLGAMRTASYLTTHLKPRHHYPYALPAVGFKDVREQIVAGAWERGIELQEDYDHETARN